MLRREMLEIMLAAAGTSMLPRLGCAGPGAAIAPGIQLYTVRTLLEKDVEGTLAELSGMGYREVELAGLHGLTPEAFRSLLDRHQLTAPSTHIGLPQLRGDPAPTFAAAKTLGSHFVVVPWLDVNERETIAAYRSRAAELNTIGRQAKDAGLQLGYHNHDFELMPINGVVPYQVLLDECDADLVKMELDLYWLAKAGGEPAAYFARHPGRFSMVHVKDMSTSGEMVDVGKGYLDFQAVFDKAGSAGIRHAFVEHDQPADPLQSARNSIAAMRNLLP